MKQIKESELKEIIKSMNGKTVKIDIKGMITTSIVLQEVVSHYSIRREVLNIYEIETERRIVVDMLQNYMIKANENKKIIEINIDNDEDITINIM